MGRMKITKVNWPECPVGSPWQLEFVLAYEGLDVYHYVKLHYRTWRLAYDDARFKVRTFSTPRKDGLNRDKL